MSTPFSVLGIDLGGCMSGNSAYVHAEITAERIRIIETFKEPRHKDHETCQRFLLEVCSRPYDAIAVDAPLGIPIAMTDPAAAQLPRKGNGEILNPYLYRYTDYYLYREFGLRPMPPAGDRIGRLTARMIALLQKLDYRFPHLNINGQRVPIYEVYPKQIAASLGLGQYKKRPEAVFDRLQVRLEEWDEHLVDALLCAYGAGRILRGDTVQPPDETQTEGWCFPVL